MQYTEEQTNVAADRSERLLVKALAGTGKTETVALRIQSLIDGGTRPAAVQTLCFTRSARDQLRNRLDSKGLQAVTVSTVHSAAWSVLDRWCEANGREMPRVSTGEKQAKQALSTLGISPTDANTNAVLRLSNAKFNGSFDGVVLAQLTAHELLEAVKGFRALKRQNKVYDFDDLMALAAHVAPKTCEEIIVDEAQDLSSLQVRFVEGLTHERMTWVGDSNQAVFGFAGVDGGLFGSLAGWQELTLSKSFRSTEEILAVANQVSTDVLHSAKHGGTVTVAQMGYDDVAGHVVKSNPSGSHAVIGRTRNGLERIASALEASGQVVQRSWADHVAGADVHVSTVHKAKGGEWDSVTVADLTASGFDGCEVTEEEQRLFYVAVTRARQALKLITLDGDLPWKVQV